MEKFTWAVKSYNLEKFSNEEFYYVISSLLGLGFPGYSTESLYLSRKNDFDKAGGVRFILLSKDLFESDSHKEMVYVHVGQFDCEFNEIEIYTGRCKPQEMDPLKKEINVSLVQRILNKDREDNLFQPVTLLSGISRIMSSPGFSERSENEFFKLYWNSPLPEGIRTTLDLGIIGPMQTDFSGDYYLVAESDENNLGMTKIKSFTVYENDEVENEYIQKKIEVQYKLVDSESMSNYQH